MKYLKYFFILLLEVALSFEAFSEINYPTGKIFGDIEEETTMYDKDDVVSIGGEIEEKLQNLKNSIDQIDEGTSTNISNVFEKIGDLDENISDMTNTLNSLTEQINLINESLRRDSIITNILDGTYFIDKFYSKIDPPYLTRGFTYVDKYNTNSLPDGTINNPFPSLTAAFEHSFKRSNHPQIYIVWHLNGDIVQYGNEGESNIIGYADNSYVLDFSQSKYAGLTGQSFEMYGYDNGKTGNGFNQTDTARRTISNFQNFPIKVKFKFSNSYTKNIFHGYGSKICIGGSVSVNDSTFCIIELGFTGESEESWFTESWGFDINGCGIKLVNVRLMQGNPSLEDIFYRPFIEGRNYEYQLIKSSDFSTDNSILSDARICTSTDDENCYPNYNDGRFMKYNSNTNSPMSGALIIKRYDEQ